MPSTSQRRRTTTRRSPRPAARPAYAPVVPTRPLLVPFAVVFGVLVAAVDGYFVWLTDFGWYLVVPLVLGLVALAGCALVWWGRRRGWVLLAVAAVVPLLGLLALIGLFALLGVGAALWSPVLMLVAPIGCLSVVLRRPVRRWRAPAPSPGGRRGRGTSG